VNSQKSEFLGTAFRAAMLAGDFIARNTGTLSQDDIAAKQASDFVTRIDRESEQVIIKTIKCEFPQHRFLAEESPKEMQSGEYLWIIDPLDGTTNFIHSFPFFSVSIALQHKGDIILGVVFDPVRNELFTAEKDKGCFLNGKPVQVSVARDMANSLVSTGFPFRKRELIDAYLLLFKNIFSRVSDIRRAGSAALDLAYVACGRSEGFFEIGLSPWDIAAGSLLIQEAGGIISDFNGGKDYLSSGNIIAAPPAIHGELLNEVKGIFKGIIDK